MRRPVYALVLVVTLAGCSANQSAPAPASADKTAAPTIPPTPQGAPAAATQAQLPREPEMREVEIPAGTTISVRLGTTIASDTSRIEDTVRGRLTRDIVVNGTRAVPSGSDVIGTVRNAQQSGRVKGRAVIAFRFERLIVRGETLAIRSETVTREAAANRSADVKKAAIGGGAGAIVGGLFKGGKGALIGAGIGGTGAVLATRGEEVRLAAGSIVRATLQEPLTVTVRSGR